MTTERNSNTAGFKVMTWQAIEKMAKEMGVTFYKESNQYRSNGFGIKATPKNYGFGDQTKIEIIGDYYHNRDAEFLSNRVNRLAEQNFFLKLELWALKNNVEYVVDTKNSYRATIQIVETQKVAA